MTHPLLTSSYALALAKKINDPATNSFDRALACVELAQFAELANMVHMKNLAQDIVNTQPIAENVYVWRNGARIKVKS